LFISDTKYDALKTGMKYLAAAVVIAVASAVYGLFSHGVSSYFMTYAFMIPLIGGAIPHLIAALKTADIAESKSAAEAQEGSGTVFRDAQLAVIATLTAGSLLKGVLDIYGTTNRLLIVYPVLAALLIAVIVITYFRSANKKEQTSLPEKKTKELIEEL